MRSVIEEISSDFRIEMRALTEEGIYESPAHILHEALTLLREERCLHRMSREARVLELLRRLGDNTLEPSARPMIREGLQMLAARNNRIKEAEPHRLRTFFTTVDRFFGLTHRGMSYILLLSSGILFALGFVAKFDALPITLLPSEFIAVLIGGITLMLTAAGIRIFEFRVAATITHVSVSSAANPN